MASIFDLQPDYPLTWKDIERLAVHIPAVQQAVTQVAQGHCLKDQALMVAVFRLAQANQRLSDEKLTRIKNIHIEDLYEPTLLGEVGLALAHAESKHPAMRGAHEGYAVILEELDELWTEVKRQQINPQAVRTEALQVAAMALRFVKDVCDPKPKTGNCPTCGGYHGINERCDEIEVCLGCGKPTAAMCGCPAGTGTTRRIQQP